MDYLTISWRNVKLKLLVELAYSTFALVLQRALRVRYALQD